MKTAITFPNATAGFSRTVHPRSGNDILTADWVMPPEAKGVILFAHGSGRHSSRNRAVAMFLQNLGMGTFLLDLLTEDEEEADMITAQYRFDIPLLTRRFVDATRWIRTREESFDLPLGYFGASTGAAAALAAAAQLPNEISSVVSRGGRPDLAGDSLPHVTAPTLLLVGGADEVVIDLNRRAMQLLRCRTQLVVIPGATHLFEEPGKLEQVAVKAADWFEEHGMNRVTHAAKGGARS
jgi:alpha-beta hydrolase superfamily lysophospholipase